MPAPSRLKGALSPVRSAVARMGAYKFEYDLSMIPEKTNKILFADNAEVLVSRVMKFLEPRIDTLIMDRFPRSGQEKAYRPQTFNYFLRGESAGASIANADDDQRAAAEELVKKQKNEKTADIRDTRRSYNRASVDRGFAAVRELIRKPPHVDIQKGGKRIVIGVGEWDKLLNLSASAFSAYSSSKPSKTQYDKLFYNIEFGTGYFATKIRKDGPTKNFDSQPSPPPGSWMYGTSGENPETGKVIRPQIWVGQRPTNVFFEKGGSPENNPQPRDAWRKLFLVELPEYMRQQGIFGPTS